MRIGFEAKRLFNNFTGLGNYSRFVVRALFESYPQHHYTLYSPKCKTHPETAPFLANPAFHVRTPSGWVKGTGFGSFWRSVNLGNIASRDGVALLHGLSNELPLTKPEGLKTVVTVHDLIYKRYPELYGKVDAMIYTRKLTHACNTADRIIAISRQTAQDIRQFTEVDEKKIRVVYQGCHEQFYKQVDAAGLAQVKSKYGLPESFILNVGTLEKRKNALLILKALTKLDQPVSLVLVGKATAYQRTLNNFIARHGLQSRIHFIHKVAFSDLPAIYQMAKAFIYPSRFEGFGIPIVEAIASGVPVIAAKGSSLEEAGGEGSLYVDPDNEMELAGKIHALLANPSQGESMVDQSREHIKKFRSQAIAKELMDGYLELMQS